MISGTSVKFFSRLQSGNGSPESSTKMISGKEYETYTDSKKYF